MSVSGFKINGVLEKYKYRELADISVVENDIANGAVTESKIGAGAVTESKIGAGAITRSKFDLDVNDFLEGKADINGAYPDMTTGFAEQLKSNTGVNDQVPYNFRTSGGGAEIGNKARIDAIVGGTVVWNQLFTSTLEDGSKNGIEYIVNKDGSFTFNGTADSDKTTRIQFAGNGDTVLPIDHVFFIDGIHGGSTSTYYFTATNLGSNANNVYNPTIYKKTGSTANQFSFKVAAGATISNISVQPQIYDLTAMFGSEIADYVLGLEQANAGAGIEWFRRLFPYSDYVEDTGTLRSVKTSGHKMVGFNQWDEEWERGGLLNGVPDSTVNKIRSKNYCRCVENTVYYGRISGTYSLTAWFYDANNNVIRSASASNRTFTTPNSACYFKLAFESGYGTSYNDDVCINLSWDGERDGEYEPYEEHTYALDDVELRGIPKLDASNNLYYDGDTYEADGTVTRKYGIVDLGTLDWQKKSGKNNLFNTRLPLSTAAYGGANNAVCKAVCAKYVSAPINNTYTNEEDKTVSFTSTGYCYIEDSAYSDAATFKTSLSGVYLVYELATPTTESADPYTELQICDDFGTEEFVDAAVEANERDVAIPVGHTTFYQANLKAKLEMMPDSPDGAGDYIMRSDGSEQTWVPLIEVKELPDMPTTDGNYRLRCTVADGEVTLSWVSE